MSLSRAVRLIAVLASAAGLAASPAIAGANTSRAKHHHKRHHHTTIPQHNGGDHDSDNNGGPSDGDGNV
jgi:Ni/Co efflux regulator RcnB